MKVVKGVIVLLILVLIVGCAKGIVEPTIEEPTPAVEEVVEEEVIVEIDLTESKIMDPDNLDIKKGTTVRWNNNDKGFYHNVVIYNLNVEIPTPKDVIVQSGNINPGEYWDYVFEESGKYAVKDIYSGTMKGEITANAVVNFLETKR